MKGVLPLQQFPLRERTFMYALLTIFLVVWIVMMFAAANHADGVAVGIRVLFNFSFALVAVIGTVQMKALARAREVVGAQPMPNALWRTWVRACIVETSLACVFLAACMGVLMASPAAGAAWPAAGALLSAGLCLGALCALGRFSMLPKALGWFANAAAVVLLLALLYFRSSGVLAWFMNLPLPLLALLMLSWPLLAGSLALRWPEQVRAYGCAPAASESKWLRAAANSIRRYSWLNPSWARQSPTQQSTVRGRMGWAARTVAYWVMCTDVLYPLHWGERPDVRHLLSLLLACVLMDRALVVRDLHWRRLLMPGGWRTERIASAIFRSTLEMIYAGFALALVGTLLAVTLLTNMPGEALIKAAAGYVLVLAEIAFAVSVSLVIRALPHPGRISAVAAIAIGAAWLYYWTVIGYVNLWKAPPAGVSYAAVMMAVAYAIVRLANRLWTKDKLIACARGSA